MLEAFVRAKLLLAVVALSCCVPARAQAQTAACGLGTPNPGWVSACGAIIGNAQASAAERAKALKYRGVFYVRQRDFASAIKDFSAAIGIDANDTEALNDRALAYQLSGDLDRALADYDKAIALDPKFLLAWFNRGNARNARGNAAGALADYNQAIALKADFGPAYRNRGILRRNGGDIDSAIADETQALQYDGNDAEALALRGGMLLGKHEFDRAIADFDAVVRLRPNNAEAYNNRGAALTQKGELARALADYDRSLLIAPGQAGGYNNRGVVRFAYGSFGAAADDLERAANAAPKNPHPALWRYLAVARTGNPSTAELQNAAKAFPPGAWPAPVVDFYLGKITADALRAAAGQGDPKARAGQQCEAEFYIGEFVLAQASGKLIKADQIRPDDPGQNLNRIDPERVKEARPMLARAAETCPPGFTERLGAVSELKRMP
jgi:tetratricopeptide (TPR) repeat protein